MLNTILIHGKRILLLRKEHPHTIVEFEDGTTQKGFRTGHPIDIQCHACFMYISLHFYNALLRKKYVCQSCNKLGEANPFFGKIHTKETKELQRQDKLGKYDGNKNPFFGRNHSDETKEKLSKHFTECPSLGFLGKHHTEENKIASSLRQAGKPGRPHTEESKKRLSESHIGIGHTDETKEKLRQNGIKWAKENPEHYHNLGMITLSRHFKQTKPELKVKEYLNSLNIPHHYSCIIKGIGQFDFKLDPSILIEVHGNYWHCNPIDYPNGPINKHQEYKIKRDKEKATLLQQEGKYSLYIIWEKNINNGDFSALDSAILEYYSKHQT